RCFLRYWLFASMLLPLCLTFALTVVPRPLLAQTQIPEKFRVRLELNLCPEYRIKPMSLKFVYRVGEETEIRNPDVISTSINSSANTARVVLALPSYFTSLPLHVSAQCLDNETPGDESNSLSVNNCQALALYDTDADGIANNLEDTNCDNFFSPGDASNPDNVDSDGDGARDLVERLAGFDPTNPGDGPRPMIFSGGAFDPDNDATSNAVVWRPSNGTWYIRDYQHSGQHLAWQFGLPGDIPITYKRLDSPDNVAVVRQTNQGYQWYFRGKGFKTNNGDFTTLNFGIFGDNILPGPWEESGFTNPAVARLFNGSWSFDIYLSDGTIRHVNWGGNNDLPKVQDYDGDGVFDVAVFRPANQTTYILRSSDSAIQTIVFGSGTADHTVRGDYTGDGIDDIAYWEPISGEFSILKSDNGFSPTQAAMRNPDYLFEMQLGLFYVHVPLSWNNQLGKTLCTVVDHSNGMRYWRKNNLKTGAIQTLQWGLAGDSQG
ncbi:MAG: VCBS repeat-containing protein, partial [bacterium]|nr:VCBS repeat-containing protein [bacterium]